MPPLEDILKKVVLSDGEQISQGTEELREAFKKPDIIPSLCNVLGTSQEVQIRQYAAVLLRKRLSRKKIWLQLPVDIKKGLKEGLIDALVKEPDRSVKNSIAQLIGAIVKHLKMVNQQWPELLQFLQNSIQSTNILEQELGALALSGIADISTDSMANYLPSLCILFKHVLENTADMGSPVVYHIIMAMKLFVPALEKHKNCISYYGNLIPRVLVAVHDIASKDEQRACQELELLEDLMENNVAACVAQHLQDVLTSCLQLSLNEAYGDEIRIKAIHITGWIAKKKKKSLLKLDLVRPIVDTMFRLMSFPNDDLDDFASSVESALPSTVASQAMDSLALCMPPDKLLPLLAEYIEPAIQGDDIYKKKAAYVTLSVIVEGCETYIRHNCLESFVRCIGQGITDSSLVVRNAALFALGQFSDYLQPELTKYAPEIIPLLFTYLDQLYQVLQTEGREPHGVDRMFYALEAFIENLNEDLAPYINTLMERLIVLLNPSLTSVHLRELAISAIGSAAVAAKSSLAPYFSVLFLNLKTYLITKATTEEEVALQVQALESLGMLARGVGRAEFMPHSLEVMKLTLDLVNASGDEVLVRKGAYSLFAAISVILEADFAQMLPEVMPFLLQSVKCVDGIETHFRDEDKAFPVYEEVREIADEEDIDEQYSDDDDVVSDLEGYSIKNTYTEEKEQAVSTIREMALSTKEKFSPYLKQAFDTVYASLSYPDDDVKNSSIQCVGQLCINWYQLKTPESSKELRDALLVLIPKLAELVHFDPEHSVVMTSLEIYADLLKEIKGVVLKDEGHREAIFNCVKDVLTSNTECQKQDGEDGGPGDEDEDDVADEAEQDEMLFEYAGEVLTPLGEAMTPDEFYIIFKDLLPILIGKTKKKCSIAQRSFSTGMLAECMKVLGPTQIPKIMNQPLQVLLKLGVDKEMDVCNNAIFGLGEMAKYGKECVFPHYTSILNVLSEVLCLHTGSQLLDNVCGCIARLILTNVDAVPLQHVFPVFMKHLPLREDLEELKPVFECIVYLYQMGRHELVQELDQVVVAAADAVIRIKPPSDKDETHAVIMELLRCIRRDFPDKFNTGMSRVPIEISAPVLQMLN